MLSVFGHWYDNEFETTYRGSYIPLDLQHKVFAIMFGLDSAMALVHHHSEKRGWESLSHFGQRAAGLLSRMHLWTPALIFYYIWKWQNEWPSVAKVVEDFFSRECSRLLGKNHPLCLAFESARQRAGDIEWVNHAGYVSGGKVIRRAPQHGQRKIALRYNHTFAQMKVFSESNDETLSRLRHFVRKDDNVLASVLSMLYLAQPSMKRGQFTAAIETLAEAYKISTRDEFYHVLFRGRILRMRGSCYLQSGNLTQAEMDLREALRAVDGNDEYDTTMCVTDLIDVLERQERSKEADALTIKYSKLLKGEEG